jgi:hypothetical protein
VRNRAVLVRNMLQTTLSTGEKAGADNKRLWLLSG